MPTFTLLGKYEPIHYASEEEVLEFANAVRKAGGGELLPALLPGDAGRASSCLIANSLNFQCIVGPEKIADSISGEFPFWVMGLHGPNATETGKAIAEELCLYGRAPNRDYDCYEIMLPSHIGNAAHAFDDAKDGWTLKYRKPREWGS